MQNAMRTGALAGVLGMAAACGPGEPPPQIVIETGCVTASGDEYVLTDLEQAAPAVPQPLPATEAYLLVGADDDLEGMAGRRARVTGEADPAEVVEIRILHPMVRASATAPAEPDVTAGGVKPGGQESDDQDAAERASDEANADTAGTPRVGVGQQVRMEVSRLSVDSVEPTGEACQAS